VVSTPAEKTQHSFPRAYHENEFLGATKKPLGATKKPANSGEGDASQMQTAPSNETLRINPVAVAPLEQRHSLFTHALFPIDGSRRKGVQTTSDMSANETTFEGPTSKPEVIPSHYRNRQANTSPSLEKSAVTTGDR
jgi:hypothetical protein